MTAPRPVQRWLCLLLPQLAIDLCQRRGLPADEPLAVIEGSGSRRSLHQLNARALAGGARTGMAVATAQCLLPELRLEVRDLAAEAQAIEHLAAWAYGYSSRIGLQPTGLLLEIAGSKRLYGPEILRQMQAQLLELGFQPCFGHGPGPAAARLAARCAAAQTRVDRKAGQDSAPALRSAAYERIAAGAPLHFSEFDPKQVQMLASCGVHTLGALCQLPRDGLIRRIGRDGIRILSRLLGELDEPVADWRPPLRFASRLELPAPMRLHGALLFPLKRLLGELAAVLNGSDRSVEQLQLRLQLESGSQPPQVDIHIGLAAPGRDAAQLLELTRYALERQQLPGAVLSLELCAERLLQHRPASADLFETRGSERLEWPQLLERLRGKLGPEAVCQLELHPEHRPERSFKIATGTPAAPSALTLPRQARYRPLWLLPSPQPIARHRLELLSGPERIETGWWDDADISRDYYIARDPEQRRLWVYQERRSPQRWFVQGVYG